MRSGPADEAAGSDEAGASAGVTILCADLSASASNSVALTLATWLRRTGGPGAVDVVSLWSGGGWWDAFAETVPVWAVNDLGQPDSAAGTAPLDLGRLAERPRRPWRERLTPDDLVAGAVDATARVLRVGGLGRAADGVRGTGLRHRLAAPGRPVWLADPGAARLLAYVPAGRRVVAHHGEFDPPPADLGLDRDDEAMLRERPDAWIAGSDEAADRLRAFGVRGPVTVLPDLVDTADHAHAADRAATRRRLAGHGVDPQAPLVMGFGEIDWWEVPDSFAQVAWEVGRRATGPVHLVWVGGRSTERMLWPLRHDLRHAGLEGVADVAPATLRPLDLLAAGDAIVISRRGGFHPAQVREIEAIGLPIVRYAGVGEPAGRQGGSILVPYLDEAAMAEAVVAALADTGVGGDARAAAEQIRGGHAAEVAGAGILAVLTGIAPTL